MKLILIFAVIFVVGSSAFGGKISSPVNDGKTIFGYNYICDANDCKDSSGKSLLEGYPPIKGKIVKFFSGCVLTDAGKLFCKDPKQQPPSNISSIVDIAAFNTGFSSSLCALQSSGGISCWPTWQLSGDKTDYKLLSRKISGGLKGSVRVFGGFNSHYFCGLFKDSTFKCTDGKDVPNLRFESPVPGLKARSLLVDYDFGCAVTVDGKVQCWGENYNHQPSGVTELSGVSKIDYQKTGVWSVFCADTDKGVRCSGGDSLPSGGRYLFLSLQLMLKYMDPVAVAFGYSNGGWGVVDDACLLLKDGTMKCLKSYKVVLDPAPVEHPILGQQAMTSCPQINGSYIYDNKWSVEDLKFSSTGTGAYDYDSYNRYTKLKSNLKIIADGIVKFDTYGDVGTVAYCKDGALVFRQRGGMWIDSSGLRIEHPADISEKSYRPDANGNLIVTFSVFSVLTEKETQHSEYVANANVPPTPIPPAFLTVGTEPAIVINKGTERYVVGTPKSAMSPGLIVVRISQNGQIDTSFGTQGISTLSFGTNPKIKVKPLVVLGNGNDFIIAGELGVWNQGNLLVAKVHADGTFDTSFGNGAGWVVNMLTDYPPTTQAQSIAVDGAGQIEVKGKVSYRAFDDFSNFTAHFDKVGKLLDHSAN